MLKFVCSELCAWYFCVTLGWEKHSDEDGFYYWHVKSGTIQVRKSHFMIFFSCCIVFEWKKRKKVAVVMLLLLMYQIKVNLFIFYGGRFNVWETFFALHPSISHTAVTNIFMTEKSSGMEFRDRPEDSERSCSKCAIFQCFWWKLWPQLAPHVHYVKELHCNFHCGVVKG